MPDGSVLFGSYTRYNIARGHRFKFSSTGQFQAFFDFGWDDTLAVVPRDDDNFSIVMKDNHYDEEAGFYCNPNPAFPNSLIVCDSTGIPAGPFYITQVNKNLQPEWQFKSTETRSCHRNAGLHTEPGGRCRWALRALRSVSPGAGRWRPHAVQA